MGNEFWLIGALKDGDSQVALSIEAARLCKAGLFTVIFVQKVVFIFDDQIVCDCDITSLLQYSSSKFLFTTFRQMLYDMIALMMAGEHTGRAELCLATNELY